MKASAHRALGSLAVVTCLILAPGLGVAEDTLPADPPAVRISPAHRVPAELQDLWHTNGLDQPALHLLGQAAARQAGARTELQIAVILVDFPSERANVVAHPPEYYERMMFSHGEFPGGSVTEFFEQSSHGRLALSGSVHGWFTLSEDRAYYANASSGISIFYPRNSQRLAEEAIRLADPYINYALLDNEGSDGVPDSGDDDELIDGIVIVHQGGGGETAFRDELASIAWVTAGRLPVDGVFALPFTLNPEAGGKGIFIHEIGHLLGAPDLYDTDGGGSLGLGAWSMMAAGSLLDLGNTPSDFDAYSKTKLGFVNVETITQNRFDMLIPPVLESGTVYRMFRGGGGSTEYFLLENRQAVGIDRMLPGSGLLIYHVDERVVNNNNPSHYRVALEQADGLFQLERRFDAGSIGDAGDPFAPGQSFSRYTDPSSFDYSGHDSHIAVYDIRETDRAGELVADIGVQPSAVLDVYELELLELEGNGDGLLQAGELAGVVPHLTVSQATATNLFLSVTSETALAEVLTPGWSLGTVPAGGNVAPPAPIEVRIHGPLPSDPYGLSLELLLEATGAAPRNITAEIGVGTVVGRADAFESPLHGWTTEPVRASANNQWLYGPHFGIEGSAGFKCGNFLNGFRRGADAVLVSPPVLLPPSAELVFDHLLDILYADSTLVHAGGVVEISVNGGDWTKVTPRAGYTAFYGGSNPEWAGQKVFSLSPARGAFQTDRVDLSSYGGMVRVRFRFFSDQESSYGKGWWIDNVRIESAPTPVHLVSVAAEAIGDDVQLRWQLAEPLPQRVRWIRGTSVHSATEVSPGWMMATEHGELVDRIPNGVRRYWIEGMERDGHVERWGPWEARAVGNTRPMTWSMLGSPGRGSVRFTLSEPLLDDATLQIFDITGRLIQESRVAAGAREASWTGGSTLGMSAAPGVYFARLQGTPLPPARIVRVP